MDKYTHHTAAGLLRVLTAAWLFAMLAACGAGPSALTVR